MSRWMVFAFWPCLTMACRGSRPLGRTSRPWKVGRGLGCRVGGRAFAAGDFPPLLGAAASTRPVLKLLGLCPLFRRAHRREARDAGGIDPGPRASLLPERHGLRRIWVRPPAAGAPGPVQPQRAKRRRPIQPAGAGLTDHLCPVWRGSLFSLRLGAALGRRGGQPGRHNARPRCCNCAGVREHGQAGIAIATIGNLAVDASAAVLIGQDAHRAVGGPAAGAAAWPRAGHQPACLFPCAPLLWRRSQAGHTAPPRAQPYARGPPHCGHGGIFRQGARLETGDGAGAAKSLKLAPRGSAAATRRRGGRRVTGFAPVACASPGKVNIRTPDRSGR